MKNGEPKAVARVGRVGAERIVVATHVRCELAVVRPVRLTDRVAIDGGSMAGRTSGPPHGDEALVEHAELIDEPPDPQAKTQIVRVMSKSAFTRMI